MQKLQTIVVALGGNALQRQGEADADAQQHIARITAEQLIPLIKAGHTMLIVHGNGPQIGDILLHEEALDTPLAPPLPLDSIGAMSEGLIGYWLQQALGNALREHGIDKTVATVVTQTIVNADDPAFQKPAKPIGPFFATRTLAERAAEEHRYSIVEDSGHGWRRVVASPKPQGIVELSAIRTLLAQGCIVVAGGGGGVPVAAHGSTYSGVDAVVDKDYTAALLAHCIDAHRLLIATSVEGVFLHYNTTDQTSIGTVDRAVLRRYIAKGHFGAGSMLPKVEAAIDFTARPRRVATICSLEHIQRAFNGKVGTTIASDAEPGID